MSFSKRSSFVPRPKTALVDDTATQQVAPPKRTPIAPPRAGKLSARDFDADDAPAAAAPPTRGSRAKVKVPKKRGKPSIGKALGASMPKPTFGKP